MPSAGPAVLGCWVARRARRRVLDSSYATTLPRLRNDPAPAGEPDLFEFGDLADRRLDGGHLASVVRDALITRHIDVEALIAALRPHAHRYGVSLGDGEALLRRFLDEAGLPPGLVRAAEAARRIGIAIDRFESEGT